MADTALLMANRALAALTCPHLFSSLVLIDPVIVKPVGQLIHDSPHANQLVLGALLRRETWSSRQVLAFTKFRSSNSIRIQRRSTADISKITVLWGMGSRSPQGLYRVRDIPYARSSHRRAHRTAEDARHSGRYRILRNSHRVRGLPASSESQGENPATLDRPREARRWRVRFLLTLAPTAPNIVVRLSGLVLQVQLENEYGYGPRTRRMYAYLMQAIWYAHSISGYRCLCKV